MNESSSEMYSRVCQMIVQGNLPNKDVSALRHVLGLVNALADTVATLSGSSFPAILEHHGKLVQKVQEIFPEIELELQNEQMDNA